MSALLNEILPGLHLRNLDFRRVQPDPAHVYPEVILYTAGLTLTEVGVDLNGVLLSF